eukprot:1206527-Rhodomonas_salina.2
MTRTVTLASSHWQSVASWFQLAVNTGAATRLAARKGTTGPARVTALTCHWTVQPTPTTA